MSLFCLSHNLVYSLYFCRSLDISKINEQGCGLARKGHGSGVNDRKKVIAIFGLFILYTYTTEQVGKSRLLE